MKQVAMIALIVAIVSLVIAVISRLILQPVMGIESQAIVQFAQTCLLLAIALALLEKK